MVSGGLCRLVTYSALAEASDRLSCAYGKKAHATSVHGCKHRTCAVQCMAVLWYAQLQSGSLEPSALAFNGAGDFMQLRRLLNSLASLSS